MATLYHWRAFVGPRYEPTDSACHYQWANIWNFNLNISQAQTTLAATLADGAGVASLTSATNMAVRGGVWVGANGDGQAWEYVAYTGQSLSTLTGLLREPAAVREHNGVHTAGAAVRQWWEIMSDDGRLTLSEQIEGDTLSAITWGAEIAGVLAPQAALRADHLIIIQTRAAGGSWDNTLLGVIRQPRIQDDYRRLRTWRFSVVCLADMAAGYVARSIRVGDLDLARAGSVSADTPLAWANKEFFSGEFDSSAPDLSGSAVVDGDPDSVWIAERYRGAAPLLGYPGTASVLNEGRFVCGARLRRWPGEAKGHRWLEFITPNANYPNFINNGWLCQKEAAAAVWVNFDGMDTSPGQLIIFCENQTLFERDHPLAEPAATFEIGSGWFDALDPAGDAIAVYVGGWWPTFAYGTGGRPYRPGANDDPGHQWTTNTIPAPGVGQIIRYAYNANWTLDKDHFPVDTVDMAAYRMGGEDPWLQIALPVLGLALRDDIAAGYPGPGAALYLVKGEAGSSEGLTTSGVLQVGMEQIAYSSRLVDGVIVSQRGANGTAAASHSTRDLMRVIDTDGVATQGQLIKAIRWVRKQAPYPQSFKIRVSSSDGARVPSDDNHDADYAVVANVTNHAAASYMVTLSPSRRVTHVLIEIDHMTTDPARPRLNTVNVLADPAAFDSNVVLAAVDAVTVIARVLTTAGVSPGAIYLTPGAPVLDDAQTAEGEGAWSVAADLAARCNVLINCTRGGRIEIGPNVLPVGVLSASSTWTDVNAASVEFAQAAAGPVTQVVQPWRLGDGTTGIARYPTTPAHAAGQTVERDEGRFASQVAAQAAAQRLFGRLRYPVQMVVQCAEGQPGLRPGAVVNVQWLLANDMQPVDRLGVVVGADHEIQNGMWTTVLTVDQLDREWSA